MLGLFTKRDQSEDILKLKNNEFEIELSKKDKIIQELKRKLNHEKELNLIHEDKIKNLTWELEEEKENTKKLVKDESKERFHDLLELFGYENKKLKESLTVIQNSIANSSDKAKESLILSDRIDDDFGSSFKEIEKIVLKLDQLLNKSHSVANVIDDLSKKAIDIEKFIAQINEVVMQINILSLNASVEAASAGDAGKGFAVVASEVKNLANRTSSVALNIEKTVKLIQNSIKNTNNEFKDIDETITGIHSNTMEYDNKIKNLHSLTKKSLHELSNLSDSVFMNLAKIDHVIWKVNSYKAVYDKKPTFKFVDHKNCRLGQWYIDGDGHKYFSSAASYYKLDKPHSAIHDTTHKVFGQLKEDENDMNYKRLKDTFSYMESNSEEVFEILDTILKEIAK